jgi:cathepsin A (carboxypeptidase C)
MLFVFIFLLAIFATSNAAGGEDDLVKNVPGLIFETNFKVYSGYLKGNENGTWKMHYMLTESRNDPKNDPLLFWFNGGPGCSSFSGAFEELGPFYINADGKTLYENVYSWNARANVLYLESPIGVGFSYDTTNPKFFKASDDQTLDQNYHALMDFFNNVQTKYKGKDFYLSGESYAGIYLPMLGAKISENKNFPANLKGIAIGNGFMNVPMLTNSLILWSNYHGRIALDDWITLKNSCCTATDKDDCDWTQYLKSTNNIDYVGDNSDCGKILNPVINATGLYNIDPYNYYEDCYNSSNITYKKFGKPQRQQYQKWKNAKDAAAYSNTANQINRDSTDPLLGYPCHQEDYVALYFNDPNVQDAYNIDKAWKDAKITFSDCNMDLYNSYKLTYNDMSPYFETMINNLQNFRILVYNGDVDTVCNFLGDAKFIDKVSKGKGFKVTVPRNRWYFRKNIAGFYQRYEGGTNFTIDVLTVKGAGHMVPLDRPGPSVQMITNFIMSSKPDYNSSTFIDPTATPAPLLSQNSVGTSSPSSQNSTVTSSTTYNDFSILMLIFAFFML